MNRHGLAVLTIGVAVVVGLGGRTVLASPQQTPAQQAATLAATWISTETASLVRVVGFVWTDQDRPVPYPRLVIRDLTDGMIVGTTIGTELGEFHLEGLSAGSYIIELLPSGVALSTYAFASWRDGVNRFDIDASVNPANPRRTGIPMESEHVLAVSQPFNVVAGDTVGTFLRVSGSLQPGLQPGLVFGVGSSVFESAGETRVRGFGGSNPVSSER